MRRSAREGGQRGVGGQCRGRIQGHVAALVQHWGVRPARPHGARYTGAEACQDSCAGQGRHLRMSRTQALFVGLCFACTMPCTNENPCASASLLCSDGLRAQAQHRHCRAGAQAGQCRSSGIAGQELGTEEGTGKGVRGSDAAVQPANKAGLVDLSTPEAAMR